MSYKATAWAYDLPLKGPAKPVLTALADFADESGSCYPGQEKLCLMTGYSLRAVQRALARLEDMGLITREHRYDRRGYRTSDRYVLSLDIQVLGVTEPSSQRAFKSDSRDLGVTVTPIEEKNHQVDPSGGQKTPDPVPRPDPWCKRHASTEGTDRACTACGKAREAYNAWQMNLVAGSRSEVWQPARKPVKHIPGLCDAHRQPEATCEMCEREARDTIQAQFGDLA